MTQSLIAISLLVRDYDEAIRYYTESLGFQLIEDSELGGGKRWIVVAPSKNGARLLLAKAATERQQLRVGDQTGGRVFLFLQTDDLWRDYHAMKSKGVDFIEEPRHETYGTVVVFQDLYGNKWDLVQPARQ